MSHTGNLSGPFSIQFKLRRQARVCVLALLAIALPMTAHAKGLQTDMQAYVVSVNDKGKEVIKKASSAEPGQMIEYRIKHKNESEGSLNALLTNGPIPKNTEYVPGSATTKVASEFEASIDGGANFAKEPLMRRVKDASGKFVEEEVPASEYTHVRWKGDTLKKGKSQEFRYRVLVQ